ncbi:MAG: glutamyl-tRNA reductase [Proteobacteria bacterium]|nr:glutamyl-tRNA reductase [Pseudomonadota bacterium]
MNTHHSTQPVIFHGGVNFQSSPIAFREKLYIETFSMEARLKEVAKQWDLKELLILQTCHRVEMFAVMYQPMISHGAASSTAALDDHDYRRLALKVFSSCFCLQNKGIDLSTWHKYSYSYSHINAARHMMNIVASLASCVVGETQIIAQFKQSLQHARKAGTLHAVLGRLAEVSLATSKKIRTFTHIGSKTVSLAHTALDLAKTIYCDLNETHMVIVGAGHMARLCCHYASTYRPRSITVVNRNESKAQELITPYPQGKTAPLLALPDVLKEADIVICATNAHHYLIHSHTLQHCHQERAHLGKTSLYLCDLSMPRNIDPACSSLNDVYLFHVDDLEQVVAMNHQERKEACKQAAPYIEAATQSFARWLSQWPYRSILKAFDQTVCGIVQEEVQKTAQKHVFEPSHYPHLKRLAVSIQRKLTASLAKSLKEQDPHQDLSHLSAQTVLAKHAAQQATSRHVHKLSDHRKTQRPTLRSVP